MDAQALVTGQAVYTDDIAPDDCLIVKVLRSPHAHALIRDVQLSRAKAVPGIEAVFTYKDCPDKRFTLAGQTYPEPSPYDRLILDQRVRFVGRSGCDRGRTDRRSRSKSIETDQGTIRSVGTGSGFS